MLQKVFDKCISKNRYSKQAIGGLHSILEISAYFDVLVKENVRLTELRAAERSRIRTNSKTERKEKINFGHSETRAQVTLIAWTLNVDQTSLAVT